MNAINIVASAALPITVILFITAGVFKRIDIFNSFIIGAEKGLKTLFKIAPSLIALVFAVKLLRGSGIIDMLSSILSPVLCKIGIPADIVPLSLLKSVSGSGSTALLTDIFENFGPDTKEGLIASVMCCSSETTFYTIAVYYGSVPIKNTRHTIAAALIADAAAIVFSILFVNLMF